MAFLGPLQDVLFRYRKRKSLSLDGVVGGLRPARRVSGSGPASQDALRPQGGQFDPLGKDVYDPVTSGYIADDPLMSPSAMDGPIIHSTPPELFGTPPDLRFVPVPLAPSYERSVRIGSTVDPYLQANPDHDESLGIESEQNPDPLADPTPATEPVANLSARPEFLTDWLNQINGQSEPLPDGLIRYQMIQELNRAQAEPVDDFASFIPDSSASEEMIQAEMIQELGEPMPDDDPQFMEPAQQDPAMELQAGGEMGLEQLVQDEMAFDQSMQQFAEMEPEWMEDPFDQMMGTFDQQFQQMLNPYMMPGPMGMPGPNGPGFGPGGMPGPG